MDQYACLSRVSSWGPSIESMELHQVNVDAPLYDYKDAVLEFATFEMFLKTPKAQACAEDIAIWVKKYISLRGLEFSY